MTLNRIPLAVPMIADAQIRNIVNRATQEGRFRRMKRGFLGSAETRAQEIE